MLFFLGWGTSTRRGGRRLWQPAPLQYKRQNFDTFSFSIHELLPASWVVSVRQEGKHCTNFFFPTRAWYEKFTRRYLCLSNSENWTLNSRNYEFPEMRFQANARNESDRIQFSPSSSFLLLSLFIIFFFLPFFIQEHGMENWEQCGLMVDSSEIPYLFIEMIVWVMAVSSQRRNTRKDVALALFPIFHCSSDYLPFFPFFSTRAWYGKFG